MKKIHFFIYLGLLFSFSLYGMEITFHNRSAGACVTAFQQNGNYCFIAPNERHFTLPDVISVTVENLGVQNVPHILVARELLKVKTIIVSDKAQTVLVETREQ